MLGLYLDDYTKKVSVKEKTSERQKGKIKESKAYIVQDCTVIKDKNVFLGTLTLG